MPGELCSWSRYLLCAAEGGQIWAMLELSGWHLSVGENEAACMWFNCVNRVEMDVRTISTTLGDSRSRAIDTICPTLLASGTCSRNVGSYPVSRILNACAVTACAQLWARHALASHKVSAFITSCRIQAFDIATRDLLSGTLSYTGVLQVIWRLRISALLVEEPPASIVHCMRVAQRSFIKKMRHAIISYWTVALTMASGQCCSPPPSCVLETMHTLAAADLLDDDVFQLAIVIMRRWATALDGDLAVVRHPCQGTREEATRGGLVLREFRDDHPHILWVTKHWLVVYKPAMWAVSWNVKIASDLAKIEHYWMMSQARLAELNCNVKVPLDCDLEPFGRGDRQAKPCDLLHWLLRSCEHSSTKVLRSPLVKSHTIQADRCLSYGLSHRLDAQTSGPLIVARSYWGWAWFQLLFRTKKVIKRYLCLCHGRVGLSTGTLICLPLSRKHIPGRVAMRSVVSRGGVQAVTEITQVAHLRGPSSHNSTSPLPRSVKSSISSDATAWYSLVEIRLWTGRLHQIRVHMAAKGYPLVADALYGGGRMTWCPRLFLHCVSLGFPGDIDASHVKITCKLPADLRQVLYMMEARDDLSHNLRFHWLGCSERNLISSRLADGRWFGRVTQVADEVRKRPGLIKFKSNDRFYTIPLYCTMIQCRTHANGSVVSFFVVTMQNRAFAIDPRIPW